MMISFENKIMLAWPLTAGLKNWYFLAYDKIYKHDIRRYLIVTQVKA